MKGRLVIADERFKKWLRWMEQIEEQVKGLCASKYTFESVREMVNGNKDKRLDWSNRFFDHLGVWYIHSTLMAVRRQIKGSQDNSLAKLLSEIRDTPSIISEERYFSNYGDDEIGKDVDKPWFREEWMGECAEHIDPEKVAEDLESLKEKSKAIENIADKRIAHFDKGDVQIGVTLNELNECVDFLEHLVIKYKRLLTGITRDSLLPEHMREEWMDIFTFPWKEASDDDELEP